MRRLLLPAAVLVLAVLAFVLWRVSHPDEAVRRAHDTLAATLEPLRRRAPRARTPLEEALLTVYRRHGDRPLWSDGRRPAGAALAAVRALAALDGEGLDPADYRVARLETDLARFAQRWPPAPPETLAMLDLRLTRALLRAARDLHAGRLPDAALDPDWVAARPRADLAAWLDHARRGPVAESLAALAPRGTAYALARAAYRHYHAAARAGGFPALARGAAPARGESGPRVAALRRRLAWEDAEVDTSDAAAPFDAALARALRAYQSRHGLRESGALDPPTRAALAVPASARARTLALNLERRRWLAGVEREPFLEVNVPAFTLQMRDSGRVVERMRVVVGEPRNPTPVFSDVVTYLQFNPPWRVPRRIVAQELLPAWRRDTTYLTKNRMHVFYQRTKVPLLVAAARVDWQAMDQDTFGYLVVQDGGEGNPLGRIKFMCPNEYDVYLHDTSARAHFAEAERARSHGCVRLERPFDLAARLLATQMEAARDSVDSLVARGAERDVGLRRRIPVHVAYWTAWVDSAGGVQFRDDLYGLDQRLAEALRTGTTRGFVINPPLEWSEAEEEARAPALNAARR